MNDILTRAVLDGIETRLASQDEDVRMAAEEELGSYCGTGTPYDDDAAEQIGPDYICALDTGEIVAWGGDYVICPGVDGRKIVVYAPPA